MPKKGPRCDGCQALITIMYTACGAKTITTLFLLISVLFISCDCNKDARPTSGESWRASSRFIYFITADYERCETS